MQKIKYYIEKYRLIIILIVVILFLMGLIIYKIMINQKRENKEDIKTIPIIETLVESEEVKDIIKYRVDIKGYVENPGVYELDENSRVIDVINKSGGLKENANTEYINLSKKITDEMVIIIYSNNDVEKYKETDKEIIYIEYECICPDNLNDACITTSDVVNTNGAKSEFEEQEKISINNSTLEELMTLNGIGESKARAIIEYREKNGEFKQLEELMNVSGIGESAYSKIKDSIKL